MEDILGDFFLVTAREPALGPLAWPGRARGPGARDTMTLCTMGQAPARPCGYYGPQTVTVTHAPHEVAPVVSGLQRPHADRLQREQGIDGRLPVGQDLGDHQKRHTLRVTCRPEAV